MAAISSITLPDGNTFHFKDAESREYISKSLISVELQDFSNLPLTIQNGSITKDHTVLYFVLGSERAQMDEWIITTYDGYFTISGNISGSTSMKIIFGLLHNT